MDKGFDYLLNYKNLNLRLQPELYRMGKGEQGVLLVEPYKSEILPFWNLKHRQMQKNLELPLQNFLERIRNKMILPVWIWQESFYKWVYPQQTICKPRKR